MTAGLADPARAIGGPVMDALCFWGVPLILFVAVQGWMSFAAQATRGTGDAMAAILLAVSSVITFAHLVAVAPRAYLNKDVFAANRRRLVVTPLLLMAALLLSHPLLLLGSIIAIFWDVHHSAMQNFGLARIYDMKAGNDAALLRKTDMRLNWFLYVGPLLAGASLMTHFATMHRMDQLNISMLSQLPGWVESQIPMIRCLGIGVWVAAVGGAIVSYRRAMAAGYRLPVHKAALIGTTGLVSLLAWGFSSPIVAFATINIYHAIQYFALVWLKEGSRIGAVTRLAPRAALAVLVGGCGLVGVAYYVAGLGGITWIMAPFITCSLMHFWFDSFVWSVTKKQV